MKKVMLILFFICFTSQAASHKSISINDINSHSGSIITVGDKYYLFGEFRESNDGKHRTANNQKITLYSSTDLINWYQLKDPIDLTKDPNDYEVERPKILFDNVNNYYVLYFHVQPHRKFAPGIGLVGIAKSDEVVGPYKIQGYYQIAKNNHAKVSSYSENKNSFYINKANSSYEHNINIGQEIRDFYAFKYNNSPYLVYSAEEGFSVQIAKLDSNYLKPSGDFNRLLIGERHEAPVFVQHNDKQFFIFSGISGYKPSTAKVYEVNGDLTKMKYISNFVINSSQNQIDTTFGAQPAFIFKCINKNKFVFVGDKWLHQDNLKNLWQSKYLWAEIIWDKSGNPHIQSSSIDTPNKICD